MERQGEAARLWSKLTSNEATNQRRGAILEGRGGGSDGASSTSGSRKHRSKRRGDEGGGRGNGRMLGKDAAETGSLFELRHVLRVREDELLRLKRDVAAAASTSGGIGRLSASITGGDDRKGVPTAEPSVARLGLSVGSRGDNGDNRPPPCSTSSSLLDGTSRFTAAEEGAGASVFDDGGDKQSPAEITQSTVGREGDLPRDSTALLVRPNWQGNESNPSSQRLLLLPPPSQAFPLAGGHAPSSGSPLVASAYEGLRQMRVVLEEREREAGRAKEDTEKMVRVLPVAHYQVSSFVPVQLNVCSLL